MKKNAMMMLLVLTSLINGQCVFAALLDPTRPVNYVASGAQSTAMQLSAILYSHARKVAVINGEVMRVGDEIAGNRLVSIKKNFVLLEGPTGRIKLFLLEQSIVPDKKKKTVVPGNQTSGPLNIQEGPLTESK